MARAKKLARAFTSGKGGLSSFNSSLHPRGMGGKFTETPDAPKPLPKKLVGAKLDAKNVSGSDKIMVVTKSKRFKHGETVDDYIKRVGGDKKTALRRIAREYKEGKISFEKAGGSVKPASAVAAPQASGAPPSAASPAPAKAPAAAAPQAGPAEIGAGKGDVETGLNALPIYKSPLGTTPDANIKVSPIKQVEALPQGLPTPNPISVKEVDAKLLVSSQGWVRVTDTKGIASMNPKALGELMPRAYVRPDGTYRILDNNQRAAVAVLRGEKIKLRVLGPEPTPAAIKEMQTLQAEYAAIKAKQAPVVAKPVGVPSTKPAPAPPTPSYSAPVAFAGGSGSPGGVVFLKAANIKGTDKIKVLTKSQRVNDGESVDEYVARLGGDRATALRRLVREQTEGKIGFIGTGGPQTAVMPGGPKPWSNDGGRWNKAQGVKPNDPDHYQSIKTTHATLGVSSTFKSNSAVSYYTGSGAYEINGRLRSDAGLTESQLHYLQKLDDIVAKSVTKADTYLYRGIGGNNGLNGLPPPPDFVDKGFSSLSINPRLSLGFASNGVVDGQSIKSLFKIRVPKGHNAAFISRRSTLQEALSDEAEVLMPRQTRYRYVGTATEVVNGTTVRVIEMEVVRADGSLI